MSLSVQIQLKVTTTEFLTNDDLNADSRLTHTGYDSDVTLTGTTSPDVTKAAYQTVTLSTGATIDLTSLILNTQAVTLTGLQPRGVHFKNTGSNDMTIVKGASNGYTGFGSSFSITLKPGMEVACRWALDNAGAVGSGSKTLDVTGTDNDTLQVSIVAGT